MEKEEFHALLQKLHNQIENTDTLDEESQQLLKDLMKDVQRVVRMEGSKDSQVHSLTGRLNAAVQRFEATHPDLTYNIAQIMEILSGAGI